MNSSSPAPRQNSSGRGSQGRSKTGRSNTLWRSKSTLGIVATLAIVGLYCVVAPSISRRIGFDLPSITAADDGSVQWNSGSAAGNEGRAANVNRTDATIDETAIGPTGRHSGPLVEYQTTPDEIDLDAGETKPAMADSSGSQPQISGTNPSSESGTQELLYGRLKEISADRYLSLSGLLYTPGSAEGHRLEHLRRHVVDAPVVPANMACLTVTWRARSRRLIWLTNARRKNRKRRRCRMMDARSTPSIWAAGWAMSAVATAMLDASRWLAEFGWSWKAIASSRRIRCRWQVVGGRR